MNISNNYVVWYVQGADPDLQIPLLFDTKDDAEVYARACFPNEDPDTRYARIFYRAVVSMKEQA